MRPVLGRDRLPEELARRRIEGVVEADKAGVAGDDTTVGELDLLWKPLEMDENATVPSPLSVGPVPTN
jgi:hypothetical protein